MESDVDIDEFLSRPLFAHLATSSKEGPRESPVWFLWEDGAIWLMGNHRDSFLKRLREDGRCAIGIVDFRLTQGILQHVGMRGKAQVLPIDRDRMISLLRRYLGDNKREWNPWFRANVIDGLDLMIRFEPESMVAREQSYFGSESMHRPPRRETDGKLNE